MNLDSSYHNPMQFERFNPDLARPQLDAVLVPGEPFEIRIMNTRRGGPCKFWPTTLNGFFTDIDLALPLLARVTGSDAPGIYFTINPLKEHVLNWNHNTIGKAVSAASDEDVKHVVTLFLDIDPVRPRFTCATTEEHEAAKRRGNEVATWLMDSFGFPLPAYAGSSGSGATAMWRVEDATADLIERVLTALDDRFSDETVHIDGTVHNPARVARLAGSVNAKSPTPQPDRPWRHATGKVFASTPVTREQLEAVAALAPAESRENMLQFSGSTGRGSYDLRALLDAAGIIYTEKKRTYGTAFELKQCLTSDQHDSGASFLQFDSGAVAYRCLHDSCSGRGWADVKHQLGITRTVSRLTSRREPYRPIKIGADGMVAS